MNFFTGCSHSLFMLLSLLGKISGRNVFAQVGKMVPYDIYTIP